MEVTLNPPPKANESAVAAPEALPVAPGVTYVPAKDGRRFGLKKLKPSARFLLAEAVETKTGSGEMQAVIVATVFSIDNDVKPPVENKADLLARLDEIGDDGLRAITGPVMEMYGVSAGDIATAKNS